MSLYVICSAAAQTAEPELRTRLEGKELLLRGGWGSDNLQFDGKGQPMKKYPDVAFSESGIHVQELTLHGSELHVEGVREGLIFAPDGQVSWLPLTTKKYSGRVHMVVRGTSGDDFGPALNAIFATSLADLVPSLPSYWQPYAREHFLPTVSIGSVDTSQNEKKKETVSAQADSSKVEHVGGAVKPPRLIKQVDPKFSFSARLLKRTALVRVYMVVPEDGVPRDVQIKQPAGLGLDEAAIFAVRQYRFAPAERDGKPVPVDLYIDVNFAIF